MKIPKLKMPYMVFPTLMTPFAIPHLTGPAVAIPWFSFQLVWIVWMIASVIAPGAHIGSGLTRRQKHRLEVEQRIRELEKESGYEPLDLEWPEGLLEELRKEKE